MRPRSFAALALVVGLALSSVACGDDDVKASKFESELRETANLTADQASCVSDKTFEEFDQGEVNEIYKAEEGADLEDLDDRFTKILEDCAATAE